MKSPGRGLISFLAGELVTDESKLFSSVKLCSRATVKPEKIMLITKQNLSRIRTVLNHLQILKIVYKFTE